MAQWNNSRGTNTKTISLTSGKGGVGKTILTVNFANLLSRAGNKVLILDGDIGLANVDILFGIRPHKTLQQFFQGMASLDEVILKVDKDIHLIPGANGLENLSQLSHFERKMLIDEVSRLDSQYDYLLIDTASGVDDNVLYLNGAVQQVCVVVLPEPTSLTDSYALIKLMNQKFKQTKYSIICNQVLNDKEGRELYHRLSRVCSQFLNVSLDYMGSVPFDAKLRQSISDVRLITKDQPEAHSSIAINQLVEKIKALPPVIEKSGGVQFFWNQILGVA